MARCAFVEIGIEGRGGEVYERTPLLGHGDARFVERDKASQRSGSNASISV